MSEPRESKCVPRLGRFRLDGWAVHQDQGTLISEGHLVRLEPRVMDVLVCLAAEPGAVVSKDDLLEVVWAGTFVEEGALSQAIHSLRKALGDDAKQPRFIQTIHKRGYRLVASVVPEVTTPEPIASPPAKEPAPPVLAADVPLRSWRAGLLAGVALLMALLILGLRERTRTTSRPPLTLNPEAHSAYLRGLDLRNQPFYSPESVEEASRMFERATAVDPTFAAAWAELSRARCYLAFNTDRSPARVAAAREAMERAVAIAPGLPSVWLARVDFSYRCQGDFDGALALLETALRSFPDDPELHTMNGFLLRRKARFPEAAEELRRAFTLDPKQVMLLFEAGETYSALRDYEEAERCYHQAAVLAPDSPFSWEQRARNELARSGDLAAARALLAQAPNPDAPELLTMTVRLDLYARDYRRALSRLTPRKVNLLAPVARLQLATLTAVARERAGDHGGALAIAEADRAELEELVQSHPKEPLFPALLAIALAQLGRNAEASALAAKAAFDNRHDSFGGPNVVEYQAITASLLGRRGEAIGLLSHLLATPYRWSISVNDLRLDPVWDSLRGDPSFEKLLEQFSR